MSNLIIEVSDYVSKCLQLAILLEVSAYPKPGNVHRTADFVETRYEHFLASSIAVSPHFKQAASRGTFVSNDYIESAEVGIGGIIKNCVRDVNSWQHGGNTILGSILLLSPIAVAAGMTLEREKFSIKTLRDNIKKIVESTTPIDAVDVYDALSIANPGGLGQVPRLDVTNPSSKNEIMDNQVSLQEIFQIAAEYDSIAFEWVNNFKISLDTGYPYFASQLRESNDINVATVYTFLKILSEVPDTLITRKVGLAKSKEVSRYAKSVLEMGDLIDSKGREKLRDFDEYLRTPTHDLNPGTTADIITAVISVKLLDGYRP